MIVEPKFNSCRFVKCRIETKEEKVKRVASFTESWKERKDYIGDIKNPKIYNCWRAFMFTLKGKNIGCSDEWKDYRTFYNDVIGSYNGDYTLVRIDKSKPFSKDNFIWIDKSIASSLKNNNILIEYNGQTKTIKEWATDLRVSVAGIKGRYYKKKDLTNEEILLGIKKNTAKKLTSAHDVSGYKLRAKASKMCSSYKIKDKKKRFDFNLDSDWMIENILFKECTYCGDKDLIGCDRLDNDKGHTKDNVVPCCVSCNTVRGNNFTYEEMLVIGKTLKEIKANRIAN